MYLNSGEFYVLQHFFLAKCHRAVTFGYVAGRLTPRSIVA